MGLLGWCLILGSCAFVLAVMAVSSCYRILKLLRSHSVRSQLELSRRVIDLQSSCESLSTTVQRLQSKYTMRETRAKARSGSSDDTASLQGPEWKAAMRRKLIKPGEPVRHME